MSRPKFSVLLPTKNRSEIVADAVKCVLNQTFKDFELVISDNDDSPTATRQAVAPFLSDPRVRYLRTSGTLSMHANWESALEAAKGENLLVLEDKMRLVPNALEILWHHISRHPSTAISFKLVFARASSLPGPAKIPPARWIPAEQVIQHFCRFDQEFFDVVPKAIDSCAPLALMRKAKAQSPTGFFFSYVNPDYASAFLILSHVDRILRIDEPLIYVPNNWMWQGKYSNGQAGYRKTLQIQRFMKDLPITTADILAMVPVKAEWMWINSVIYDFKTLYRPAAKAPDIDWVRYHGFCIFLIFLGFKLRGNMKPECLALLRSLRNHGALFTIKVALHTFYRASSMLLGAARNRLIFRF